MGANRIRKNLRIDTIDTVDVVDVVEYCKNKILEKSSRVYKKGKNFYCEVDNVRITINSYSYKIITAHLTK